MMSCHISLGEDIAYHLCFSQILHTNSIKVVFGYSPWENVSKIEKNANWKFIEIKSDRFLSNFDIQYYYFELFSDLSCKISATDLRNSWWVSAWHRWSGERVRSVRRRRHRGPRRFGDLRVSFRVVLVCASISRLSFSQLCWTWLWNLPPKTKQSNTY